MNIFDHSVHTNSLPELTVHCASFTQSDMVVQASPAGSHTSNSLLTCNSDLPSVLTWHFDCGSVSLPIAV